MKSPDERMAEKTRRASSPKKCSDKPDLSCCSLHSYSVTNMSKSIHRCPGITEAIVSLLSSHRAKLNLTGEMLS